LQTNRSAHRALQRRALDTSARRAAFLSGRPSFLPRPRRDATWRAGAKQTPAPPASLGHLVNGRRPCAIHCLDGRWAGQTGRRWISYLMPTFYARGTPALATQPAGVTACSPPSLVISIPNPPTIRCATLRRPCCRYAKRVVTPLTRRATILPQHRTGSSRQRVGTHRGPAVDATLILPSVWPSSFPHLSAPLLAPPSNWNSSPACGTPAGDCAHKRFGCYKPACDLRAARAFLSCLVWIPKLAVAAACSSAADCWRQALNHHYRHRG